MGFQQKVNQAITSAKAAISAREVDAGSGDYYQDNRKQETLLQTGSKSKADCLSRDKKNAIANLVQCCWLNEGITGRGDQGIQIRQAYYHLLTSAVTRWTWVGLKTAMLYVAT